MRSSFDLRDSAGVNCHFEHYNDNEWVNRDQIATLMLDAGIRHLRVGAWPKWDTVQSGYYAGAKLDSSWFVGPYHTFVRSLRDRGVKFLWNIPGFPPAPLDYSPWFGRVEDMVRTIAEDYAASTVYIEGPNEPDNNVGLEAWRRLIRPYHFRIFEEWRDRFQLAHVKLTGPNLIKANTYNGSWLDDNVICGDCSGFSHIANDHLYPGNHSPRQAVLQEHRDIKQFVNPRQPWMIGEYGFSTSASPGSWPRITERTHAIYQARAFLSNLLFGVERTYVYDMLDDASADTGAEARFGLLHYDRTPKPAYTTTKTLFGLCDKVPPTGAPPAPVNYTLTGAPPDAKVLDLYNADGSHLLVIWREADVGAAAVTAKMKLPGRTHKVSYDIIDGAPPCPYDFPDGYEFDVVISDAPIVFKV